MNRTITLLTATLLAAFAASSYASAGDRTPAAPAQALAIPAHAPAWAAKGAYVFRVSTPDEADLLPRLEEGHAIVANLLDGTVPQITIVNGLIGHDHPGAWNWDGLWPFWNRATFRAGSFEKLAQFMLRAKQNSNVYTGFHLNLTDVNIGLRDYPASREFFRKLVETRSKIYFFSWDGTRRDWKLPADWSNVTRATLYPLTPAGRGQGVPIAIRQRAISPSLLPQVPYVLVPDVE